mgnify:CR=1 FL=1
MINLLIFIYFLKEIFLILYPAIDLKDGKCVRLLRGNMNKSTIFHDKPYLKAQEFEKEGCKWLHVVDLDGAFAGKSINSKAIDEIISSTSLSIQLGGGIRTLQNIDFWLNKGVKKVIIGTAAIETPGLIDQASSSYPYKVSLGIDAKDGKVAINGWSDTSEVKSIDLLKKYENCNLNSIIYTDINKDGAMQGPNFDELKKMSIKSSFPIIASGGVSSLEDIKRIKLCHQNIKGIIVGRAIYENALNLSETLKFLSE